MKEPCDMQCHQSSAAWVFTFAADKVKEFPVKCLHPLHPLDVRLYLQKNITFASNPERMSQFLNRPENYTSEFNTGIDFDNAVKLPGGGSTCDIFKTRWHRRKVFVKRLKKELRSKPLYLDALDKEFEIGVNLKHPSLPDYREYHRDYIIMDYIDGSDLSEMIRRGDPWLSDEKHIRSMLGQLVEAVGYLHRHNVVHCDIKPDNIMITANGHNIVLVDFDKCYTDALNDTSGHPAKYGVAADNAGSVTIDFHGIAKVVERLNTDIPGFKARRYKKFVRRCYSPDVTCDELLELLTSGSSRPTVKSLPVVAATIIFALAPAAILYFSGRQIERQPEAKTQAPEAMVSDSLPKIQAIPESSSPGVIDLSEKSRSPEAAEELPLDPKQKAAIIDKRIMPYFKKLLLSLDNLESLKSNPALSGQQLLDSIRAHSELADEYISKAFAMLKEKFPETTDSEAMQIMAYSKAYTGYTRRFGPLGRAYRQEYERRFEAEGAVPQ